MKIENENIEQPHKTRLNIGAVMSSALPCPFCGEKPRVDKSFMPTKVEVHCVSHACPASPSVFESVQWIENEGDTLTYSPMFDWHWQSVLEKWNTRHSI